ncbi:hypothetical protein [Cytobacillus firmus]|uniref:hypothetical protein n=1 Tax=Cytobacillus firmus TaxID=1399 RepID=UPI002162D71F|nr:hypothetical protein [Cytobacillus firmus]MCS0670222.1 hypothetical protein [Cytobacillus firmus]
MGLKGEMAVWVNLVNYIGVRRIKKLGEGKMDWHIRKAALNDVDVITELRIELLTAVGDVNEGNRAIVFDANRRYFQEKLSNGGYSA